MEEAVTSSTVQRGRRNIPPQRYFGCHADRQQRLLDIVCSNGGPPRRRLQKSGDGRKAPRQPVCDAGGTTVASSPPRQHPYASCRRMWRQRMNVEVRFGYSANSKERSRPYFIPDMSSISACDPVFSSPTPAPWDLRFYSGLKPLLGELLVFTAQVGRQKRDLLCSRSDVVQTPQEKAQLPSLPLTTPTSL